MTLYNLRNPAVKRLMREAEELKHPTEEYFAQPLEDNLFEWHFTLQGPSGTDFEGGIYHGRITLPPEYPMKPPSIILLTPNGRFETNKKICLSISGHHPETWQPSWSIRTALLAIIGFLPTHAHGALGSLDYTPEEKRDLALKSRKWICSTCGYIKDILKKNEDSDSINAISANASECTEKCSSENDSVSTYFTAAGNENSGDSPVTNVLLRKKNFDPAKELKILPSSADENFKKENDVETTTNNLTVMKSAVNFCSVVFIWLMAIIIFILAFRRIFW